VQATLADNIKAAKEFQNLHFDCHAREFPTFEKGDWVWLLRRNITTTRPSTKLDFKRLRPFWVDLPMGQDVYCLIPPRHVSTSPGVSYFFTFTIYLPKIFSRLSWIQGPLGPSFPRQLFLGQKQC
jgi:hypothetical protein